MLKHQAPMTPSPLPKRPAQTDSGNPVKLGGEPHFPQSLQSHETRRGQMLCQHTTEATKAARGQSQGHHSRGLRDVSGDPCICAPRMPWTEALKVRPAQLCKGQHQPSELCGEISSAHAHVLCPFRHGQCHVRVTGHGHHPRRQTGLLGEGDCQLRRRVTHLEHLRREPAPAPEPTDPVRPMGPAWP